MELDLVTLSNKHQQLHVKHSTCKQGAVHDNIKKDYMNNDQPNSV